MKNRIVTGVIFIILGIAAALGPQTLFSVCGADLFGGSGEASMDMVMTCYWTGRAALGAGAIAALLGLLVLVSGNKFIRVGYSAALGLLGIYIILLPTLLIGVCGSVHMGCRTLTLPALIIIGALLALTSAANIIYLLKSNGGKTDVKAADDSSAVAK